VDRVDTYAGTRLKILKEFEALRDYIWKTPRLIDAERKLERDKLSCYFPDSPNPEEDARNKGLRTIRALLEGYNLAIRFPTYMASSNLFIAESVFEHFLFILSRELESVVQTRLTDQRGNGVSRLFAFLSAAAIPPSSLALYPEIDAIMTLRNALLHANGRLELSRERSKIESIVDRKLFIEPSCREEGGLDDERGRPEACIPQGTNQLRINNYFAYRAAVYFERYLLDLGSQVGHRVSATA
jgi:hypothetical protein